MEPLYYTAIGIVCLVVGFLSAIVVGRHVINVMHKEATALAERAAELGDLSIQVREEATKLLETREEVGSYLATLLNTGKQFANIMTSMTKSEDAKDIPDSD